MKWKHIKHDEASLWTTTNHCLIKWELLKNNEICCKRKWNHGSRNMGCWTTIHPKNIDPPALPYRNRFEAAAIARYIGGHCAGFCAAQRPQPISVRLFNNGSKRPRCKQCTPRASVKLQSSGEKCPNVRGIDSIVQRQSYGMAEQIQEIPSPEKVAWRHYKSVCIFLM